MKLFQPEPTQPEAQQAFRQVQCKRNRMIQPALGQTGSPGAVARQYAYDDLPVMPSRLRPCVAGRLNPMVLLPFL